RRAAVAAELPARAEGLPERELRRERKAQAQPGAAARAGGEDRGRSRAVLLARPGDAARLRTLGVHRVDLRRVLLRDRLALQLHRRRELVARGQPVALDDVELLDLFH